ncbi:hypothetical protein EU528_08585 [Candidatus Thorarchaeota archaeon]|nr:MAG: hypothetical protein EU528_08585 [Candidatus Thorarchaeota archaeon]
MLFRAAAGFQWGALLKLVDLAQESVRILQECGDDGIKSDTLAERLDSPKRRVYDVIAVLKALGQVDTIRKFDGTTITWIDRSKEFVSKKQHDEMRIQLSQESDERKDLQVQVAELKEQLRITRAKLRRDVQAVEMENKTEFNTTQLRVRALSSNGIKRVKHDGIEVVIITNEAGMIVDPSEIEIDEHEDLIKSLQRI